MSVPIACDLSRLTAAERAEHRDLVTRVFLGSARTVAETPQGFELQHLPDQLEPLARWMSLESRCCPFLEFELALRDEGRALIVRVNGSDEAKDVLRAAIEEIAAPRPRACGR